MLLLISFVHLYRPFPGVAWANASFNTMVFALEYQKPIDSIIADKSFKLRKYKLDNEG